MPAASPRPWRPYAASAALRSPPSPAPTWPPPTWASSVAALVATRIQPDVADWFFYGHASAEPGHAAVIQALAATPLLDLGLRLGEGSGAAVAVPLLRLACALHNEIATFAEAQVSTHL